MTDYRTSQTFVGILADWDPQLRISTTYAEVFLDADPLIRVSTHWIEYHAVPQPPLRVTQYHLEVLYSLIPMVDYKAELVNLFPKYAPVPYGERWNHQ